MSLLHSFISFVCSKSSIHSFFYFSNVEGRSWGVWYLVRGCGGRRGAGPVRPLVFVFLFSSSSVLLSSLEFSDTRSLWAFNTSPPRKCSLPIRIPRFISWIVCFCKTRRGWWGVCCLVRGCGGSGGRGLVRPLDVFIDLFMNSKPWIYWLIFYWLIQNLRFCRLFIRSFKTLD